MDPMSQGVLGAAAAQSIAKSEETRLAMLLGAPAGMAPDLNVPRYGPIAPSQALSDVVFQASDLEIPA